MNKATFLRAVGEGKRLWRMEPPLSGHSLVVTSISINPWIPPETLAFPSNEDGEIVSWIEVAGSYRSGHDHKKCLRDAGYEVA